MRKRLSLRKQQVAISLVKAGAPTLTARVVLVLDASGSMARLYSTGVVTATVERMAAVSAQLDEDGSMQAWTFATNPARLPDLELAELPEWLDLHVRVGSMFKQKPKKLRPGQLDMGKVGIQQRGTEGDRPGAGLRPSQPAPRAHPGAVLLRRRRLPEQGDRAAIARRPSRSRSSGSSSDWAAPSSASWRSSTP